MAPALHRSIIGVHGRPSAVLQIGATVSALVDGLNSWSQAWLAVVWAVLWQSTLLAMVVALVVRLLRRGSPALRYWLWQIVAIKLLLMPFWTLPVTLPQWGGREEAAGQTAGQAPEPPTGADVALPLVEPSLEGAPDSATTPPAAPSWWQRWMHSNGVDKLAWQGWLLLVWIAGVAYQLGNIVRHRVRLARLLRDGAKQSRDREGAQDDPATDPTTDRQATGARVAASDEAIGELSHRLGLRRVPRVAIAQFDGSPFVCGIRHPVLVLPRAMLDALEPDQLRQVLLHELAHVKRRDLVWGWIPEVARIFYWFHPVAHWVNYRVRLERELACDQVAMAHSGQSAACYADTLVRVVSHASAPAVLKAAAGSAGLMGEGPPNLEAHELRKETKP